jgi:hypothetical protein
VWGGAVSADDPALRQLLATVAIMLDQGDRFDRLSRPLTVASLAGLVVIALLAGRSETLPVVLIGAAVLAGLAEVWFATRVAIDAALFHQIATSTDSPDWALLDGALTQLGMMPETKSGRPAPRRAAGALRLLRYQGAALIAQCGLVAASALCGMAK